MTRTWAPGRINLIGEHTDYSGGLVLPAAIELGVTVDVHALGEAISLTSAAFGSADPFPADGAGPRAHGWARLAQAVAAELAKLGRPAVGMTATISSTLPAGVGMSSSAALEVAVAIALCAVADFEVDPMSLAAVCQRAESAAIGVPCGILDQAASLLGEKNKALLLDCGSLTYRRVDIPAEAAFLVLDSGVARALETTGYAQRRQQLESALQLVGCSTSMGLDVEVVDSLPTPYRQRLRHVVTENKRAAEFAAALENADLRSGGILMTASHASLRDDYEVSVPELDRLVALAIRHGAYGARLVGAGFGGSVIALVDACGAEKIGIAIMDEFGTQDRPPVVVHASGGARQLATTA